MLVNQGLMDTAEKLSPIPLLVPVVVGMVIRPQQASDRVSRTLKFRQVAYRRLTFLQQPIPSALRLREDTLAYSFLLAKSIEGVAQGIDIRSGHVLSNQFLLPPERAARLHGFRRDNRLQQRFVERQSGKRCGIEIDQAFAQRLQFGVPPFQCALAGFVI
ncbi:MAG: hypothetical protein QNJ19_10530 [Woeseiaceae bacterium]|nr:hypothetical protein [Woeseiaceae bacterium]